MVRAPFGLWKSIFNSFVKHLNPRIVTGLQKAELQPVTLNETTSWSPAATAMNQFEEKLEA